MISFLFSFFYFFTLAFRKRSYDVVFYAPRYFNRGENGENLYFKHLIDSCKRNKLSYIIFEEPAKCLFPRNKNAIPFDFIFYLIVFLRKLMDLNNDNITTEHNIGNLLSRSFFRNFKYKNYIVLSKSMISVFSRIDNDAKIFDLQHGIIYKNKPDYFSNNVLSPHLLKNNVSLLLYGRNFKDILIKNGAKNFIEQNTYIIGIDLGSRIIHKTANQNVLVSLQFTGDHSNSQNNKLLEELKLYIKLYKEFNFFLRDHPRFNNEVILDDIYRKENVFVAPATLNNCFNKCSIHLTAYSTITFESAMYGIPTVFFTSLNDTFNMFYSDFYLDKRKDLFYTYDHYKSESSFFKNWVAGFYDNYNEQMFISILR